MVKDKFRKMKIYIRIEIINGTGFSIIEPTLEKEFMSSLMIETKGAIKPLMENYPHFTKSYPDNGWISYYFDIHCDIEVNISQLLRDNAGWLYFIAKKFYGSEYIANTIRTKLFMSIREKLNLKDVQVTLIGDKYYK